jgi:hypothetical protein
MVLHIISRLAESTGSCQAVALVEEAQPSALGPGLTSRPPLGETVGLAFGCAKPPL